MIDVCIIGGGASGIIAAISAAKKGASVLIVDKNKKFGKKLYATGNGHCNITNYAMDFNACYHSTNNNYVDWLMDSLGAKPEREVEELFHNFGVSTYEKNGYIYPRSKQASTIVWSMLDQLNYFNIKQITQCEITDIQSKDDIYEINLEDRTIRCKQLILACGGKSYSNLGGCSTGYQLAEKLGLQLVALRPSLCGMFTEELTDAVKGVRTDCNAQLLINGKCVDSEKGELQFTEYGLSGIMIFNLSSQAGFALENHQDVSISLDLLNDITEESFINSSRFCVGRSYLAFLNGFMADKLSAYILDRLFIEPKEKVLETSYDKIKAIYDLSKSLTFKITGLGDYDTAQVTAGGVELSQINPKTMEAYSYPGLYVVGEMLDIDGICGGYNLTFAFLTGKKAGEHIEC